jgi:plasmid stabilization system protein ParE
MKKFEVVTSDEAMEDADLVYDYICNTVIAPLTAARYYQGLISTMRNLGLNADGRAVDLFLSAKYGRPTRRVNYKKYAIIYFIEGDKVIVHRVIPQKMVK